MFNILHTYMYMKKNHDNGLSLRRSNTTVLSSDEIHTINDCSLIQGFENTLAGVMSKEKAVEQLAKQIDVERMSPTLDLIDNCDTPPDYQSAVSTLKDC